MQKIITIFIIATLFSCSSNQNKTTTYPVQPLQIDNGEEEGWGADVRLSIVEKSENDTAKVYKAISSFEGKEIGLLVFVPKAKEGDKGFGKGIVLKSMGLKSDNLLRAISKLYKQKGDTVNTFIKSLTVNYVNLNEFAKSLTGQAGQTTGADEYKLFFEGSTDQEYAELYLNINPNENWIELREKDEEYRPLVLSFLRQ